MSDRSDAVAFLNLISQYRQERQLEALKKRTEEATRVHQGIEHTARRQLAFEHQRQQKQAGVEAIRQMLFDATKDIDKLKLLLEDPKYTKFNRADHVAYRARSMGMRLRLHGVEVEGVADFADKERVYELYTDLAHVYKTAVAQLTPERQNELERAFKYRGEMWRLRRLMELESKWPKVQQIRAALEPLTEQRKRTQAELAALKAKPMFALGFGARRVKQLDGEAERLWLEIFRLQRQCGDVNRDELETLRQQFGHHPLNDLEAMVYERRALIAFFAQGDEFEKERIFDTPVLAFDQKAELPKLASIKTGGGRGKFEGVLFVISNKGGEQFENWEQYFRELIARQPVYEDAFGETDGEVNAVIAEIVRGNAFVARVADERMVLLTQAVPVSLNSSDFDKLLRYFSRKALRETFWWASRPGVCLRPLDFRQAWYV